MKLKVNEIFKSIQGEGLDMGRPCTMVRLTGCNLRCSYCDTQYAFEEGDFYSIEEIVKKVQHLNCSLVEVTGGEPLMQENAAALINFLVEAGFETLIETNGSYDIGVLNEKCVKILDIKTPSSKMEKFNLYSNLAKLKNKDQVKFVVSNRNDFDFAKNIIKEHEFKIQGSNIILSPVFGSLKPVDLADWINEENLDVRMQVQLHKIIWPEDMRGV